MFILIHGAYHAGWCWRFVIDELARAGHQSSAPDLPGHGRDPGWIGDQTMENYIQRVSDAVSEAPDSVTLVGHSMGGAIAAAVADAHPEKVRRILFLTAYIPKSGECVGDVVKSDPASHVNVGRIDVGGVNAVMLKDGTLEDAFYNDADDRALAFAQSHVQLQSPAPFRHVLKLTDETFGVAAKAAIICTKDRAISPGHQRWMAERAGCDEIIDMDAGHSPFVTDPEGLTRLLIDLAA